MTTRKLARKDTLGRFRIVREIGRGGSGVVFEGLDPSDGSKVALKVLPAVRALDQRRVETFLKEAENARNLRHPNIVSLREVGSEGGNYFLVMQYVDGRPLDVYWKEELIDFDTSARVVIQILDALAHAHARGLVHLDVKPQNILLDRSGIAFLTDFGLARGAGIPGSMAGTPKYMSPEQASGKPEVDFRSDLYSLGVTLYNLITHAHPFEGEDVHVILRNVLSGDFVRPRDINNRIPSRLEAIVMKAMERDPARRYRTAAEFKADLESHLKGESVTASVPIMKRRGLRLIKTRAAFYAALALSVATVASLTAFEAFRARAPAPAHGNDEDATRKAREFSVEGDRLFSEDRIEEALSLYSKSIEIMPRDAVTLVKLGQIHSRMERFDSASRYFTEALKIEPDLAEALVGRGEARIETADGPGASADFGKAYSLLSAVKEEPGSRDLTSRSLCGLAGLALAAGELEDAARFAREARELDPASTRSRLILGLALLESGRRDLALEEFKPLIAMEPSDSRAKKDIERLEMSLRVAEMQVQIPLLRAVAHYESGKFQQAVEFSLETLRIEPQNPDALVLLGKGLIALMRFEDSLQPLEAASKSDAARPLALALRARALRWLGRTREALLDSSAAASMSPGLLDARFEFALALDASGDRPGALSELEAARQIAPSEPDVVAHIAKIHFDDGRHGPALQAARDVLDVRPHDLRATEIAARSSLETGLSDDALMYAARAIAIEPVSTAANAVRAAVLLERSDFRGALDSALIAASSKPGRTEALRVQVRAMRGLGMHRELAQACTALIAETGEDMEARRARAAAWKALGDHRGASDDLRAYLAASPGDAGARADLAEAELASGDAVSAVRTARLAADAGETGRGNHVLGLALLSAHRPAEAAEAFSKALVSGLPPAEASAAGAGLSSALRMCGRIQEALDAARAALSADLSNGDAGRAVAELLVDSGRPIEALAAAGAVQTKDRERFVSWISARAAGVEQALADAKPYPGEEGMRQALLSGFALRRGDADAAMLAAEAGVAHSPSLAAARDARARARMAGGDAQGFLSDADWLVAVNPGNPELRAMRASVSWKIPQRREQALEDLLAAGAAMPREAWVFRARADLLLGSGKPAEAVPALERLVVLEPGSAQASRLLAETYEKVHRYSDAAEAWGRAGRLTGASDQEPRIRRLKALLLAGRFRECADGAISLEPGPFSGKAALLEAECLLWSGRHSEAVEAAGSIPERNPELALEARCLRATAAVMRGSARRVSALDNEDFVKAYFDLQSYYPQAQRGASLDPQQRAIVFTAMGMYQLFAENNDLRAAEDFRKAVSAHEESRTAVRMLGRIAAAGSPAVGPGEGLSLLEKALSVAHHDITGIHHDRGRCLEALGRREEAAEAYRKSIDADPSNTESRRRLSALERDR